MANVTAKFKVESPVLNGKGKILGTTYSGHPMATTFMGTYRNFLYHMFCAHENR